jgi:hypothetical protein
MLIKAAGFVEWTHYVLLKRSGNERMDICTEETSGRFYYTWDALTFSLQCVTGSYQSNEQ